MRSTYSVLLLSYMPVSIAGGIRKAVGGYLRYMQYRDQGSERQPQGGLDAFVRYIGHRDRTSPGGRVFGPDGPLGTADRRRLVDYVARSTAGMEPKWFARRDGTLEDRQRAVYQLVISPDDWHGLDLRQITRAGMKQLEADAGQGGLGPWFAAEHRNTAHHHVQLVLAARREVAPGKFTTLIINRPRLQRMKEAIWAEIERQRELERPALEAAQETSPGPSRAPAQLRWRPLAQRGRLRTPVLLWRTPTRHPRKRHVEPVGETLLRIRGVAIRYRFQMERELEAERVKHEREVWER
jgi:hypothetical protein